MLNNENALTVGEYNFEADLNFLGVWDTTAERLDTAIMDEKASNNRKVMNLDVVNNQPSVLSMTMFNTGDLVVSQKHRSSLTCSPSTWTVWPATA